ncbi:6665_t:CDS:2 [Scutellospora calospora]|uniref:6665_t:CDS:1 n=1 Tax=Scutellospora calospora TaxID=85575 RepID=A0ACA9KWK1_9GLOM|nr:6665_t:CDS:2 [Scutellospora calospora]
MTLDRKEAKNNSFLTENNIRYNNSSSNIHEIIRGIAVLSLYTDCFEKNSLHLSEEELNNTEPLDQLIERIQQIPNAYTQLNSLVKLPFYNNQIATPDLLFNTLLSTTLYPLPLNNPLLFINLTIAITTDDIMNYPKANTSGSLLLKVELFTSDSTQDPYTWMECFEKAAAANR